MTGLPAANRRYLITRMVLLSLPFSLFYINAPAGQDGKDPFEVGQRWEYRHEGPRPGSIEPNAIDGERIMHVIGVVQAPEGKQWIIEERFTKDEKAIGRLYVNKDRLLTAIEIENDKGEAAKLKYDPPVPHQVMALNLGEEKIIETSLKMDSADFTLPSTMVIRRLDDETITTPAGEFADCEHFKIITKSIFNIKIAKIHVTEERERWYHPKVNGLVKEVYRKEPIKFLTWSRDEYTATSVLTAFDKKKVPLEMKTTNHVAHANQDKDHSQPSKPNSLATYLVLLGTTIVLTTGFYILRKRIRRTQQPDPIL